jgi:hypothetical protein
MDLSSFTENDHSEICFYSLSESDAKPSSLSFASFYSLSLSSLRILTFCLLLANYFLRSAAVFLFLFGSLLAGGDYTIDEDDDDESSLLFSLI